MRTLPIIKPSLMDLTVMRLLPFLLRVQKYLLPTLLVLTSGGVYANTLHAVFERAWANAPQAKTLVAKQQEVLASQLVAGSVFPAPPRLVISQRSDRLHDRLGKEENELGVAVPIWLPGQKSARQDLAQADQAENQQSTASARLAFAGEFRAALWAYDLAKNELAVAIERLNMAQQLESDVAKRVKVGDMARADLLLIQQETSSARAAVSEANARLVRSQQRYWILTGAHDLPDRIHEPISTPSPDSTHPSLAAGQAIIDRARAGLQLAQASLRDPPILGMQYRRNQDIAGTVARDTVGLAITIPFAGDVRNAPLIASANTALIQATAQYQRLAAELEADAIEAQAQLDAAQIAANESLGRERDASERLTLIRRAFNLGEASLIELIRTQAQATESRINLRRSQARLSAAHANLNQTRGMTP